MMQIYAGCLERAGTLPTKQRRAKESHVFVRKPYVNKKTYNLHYSPLGEQNGSFISKGQEKKLFKTVGCWQSLNLLVHKTEYFNILINMLPIINL